MLAYNDLPAVEDADSELAGTGVLSDFLGDFAELAQKFAPHALGGATLLHRHFDLPPTMRMVERPSRVKGSAALVTRPIPESAAEWARPVRWGLAENGAWTALEFSEDPAAIEAEADSGAFLAAFADLVRDYAIQHLIGFGLAERATILLGSAEYLLEENTPFESVVTKATESFDAEISIVTMWVPDVAAGCQPTSRCRGWSTCRRTGNPDRPHSYAYGHDRVREHYR